MRDHPRRAPAPIPVKTGIGLRSAHHANVLETCPDVGWYEVHAENYMGGGMPLRRLHHIRRDNPIALHAVGLSLGNAAGPDPLHLNRLVDLADRLEPLFVSEHLAWSAIDGAYLNDLLPLPYTGETLTLVCANIDRMQTALRRRILVENPSAYFQFIPSDIPEGDFLAEMARRSGCALLLDINNLYVNARNHGTDPRAVMAALAHDAVVEMHLAGHHTARHDDVTILIDDHGSAVNPDVWSLYAEAAVLFPAAATLIEWDTNLPDLAVLVAEAHEADRRRTHAREQWHAAAA